MPSLEVAAAGTLEVEALSFSYGQRLLFDRWSKSFPPGVTWLRGGNGSGKSTLLKLLAGALRAREGRLRIGAVELGARALDYKARVFWCGPGPVPYDHLTPEEYWGFMRSLYPALDVGRLEQHLAGFALGPHRHLALRALSTGTQRKVWLACALAMDTEVLLLDEPLNALDAASLAHVRQALADQARARAHTWIVSSHESLGAAVELAGIVELATHQEDA